MPWLDVDTWPRRHLFSFYRTFDDPWFNLTTEVAVGPTRAWCRRSEAPLSLAIFYAVAQAANGVPNLRLRLRDGRVWSHDRVRVGATVPTPDGAFTYAYYPDLQPFSRFVDAARAEQQRRLAQAGLQPHGGDDLLHCTALPWVRFTAIKHARHGAAGAGIPKVAVGRATQTADGVRLPVSLEAHHALVDGVHAGAFFSALEGLLAAPESLLA